ncbi:MAG: hypothetical protein V3V53_18460 [Bacteroidales bacterium]
MTNIRKTSNLPLQGLTLVLILGLLVSSCTEKDSSEITLVNYGTSFGECIGYCIQDMDVNPTLATLERFGWFDTIETQTCSLNMDDNHWEQIITGIDVEIFIGLPETFGCPDCADGGAEWVEIELQNGEKHRVTFEYHNEPSELLSPVAKLRELLEALIPC